MLARTTSFGAGAAMLAQLSQVPTDRLPTLDLSRILFWQTTTEIITTILLEPAARIIFINPTFGSPDRERLAGVNAEIVELWIMFFRTELRLLVPIFGKFRRTIRHIFATEDAEREHLLGREIRLGFGIEVFTHRFDKLVTITLLHLVVDDNRFHEIIITKKSPETPRGIQGD